MRTVAFALLALLALQSAAAFSKKPVYEPVKKPVYEPKKVEVVKKPVIVAPSPSPKPSPAPITVSCTPRPIAATFAANLTCSDGYTFSTDPKQGAICSKELCVQPAPAKPVYEPKKPVYAVKKGHYFFGKKEEKKPVYEPKKPVYTPTPKPVYVTPVPAPAPAKICRIDVIKPVYACAAGYTLSGSSCLLSVPGPCPPTYTASAGVCTYTYVPSPAAKPVYEPKKPVFFGKGHYFLGKKFEAKKPVFETKKPVYTPAPAVLAYCAESLYPKPSPVIVEKPKYEAKKPVYEPKKVVKSLFAKLG